MDDTIYQLAQSLRRNYAQPSANLKLQQTGHTYLSESIIPSATFAYRGQGASLQTNQGELIDLASMTVNCILGQNDPWVNANLVAYLLSGQPSFLTTRVGGDMYYKVARRILDAAGSPHAVINHRQSNGTDVTELAILAAYQQRQPGQSRLASFVGSYHGQGLTAYHASHLQTKHQFWLTESSTLFLDQPDNCYDPTLTSPLSDHDVQTLAQLEASSAEVFAVIIEPIQVNNSLNMPSRQFMQSLVALCKRLNIALIYDEIQTGWGWLGTMTAAELYDARPNLFTLSKALTSGNGPLAALISDKKFQAIPDGTAAKTNGADIRSLVAANAVMDRLMGIPVADIPATVPSALADGLTDGLLATVPRLSAQLDAHLQELRELFPALVHDIKGTRLIRGLELKPTKNMSAKQRAVHLHQQLLEKGVLARHTGNALLFKPPVVITNEQLESAFDIIKQVIRSSL